MESVMKSCGLFLFFIALVVISSMSLRSEDHEDTIGEDNDDIVLHIKKISNLTKGYVNSWRRYALSFLGEAGEPAAALASTYFALKGGVALNDLHADYADTLRANVLKNELFPRFMHAPDSINTILTNKATWVLAGAAGAAAISYKMIYQYASGKVLRNVNDLAYLCKQLIVADRKFDTYGNLQLALQSPKKSEENDIWLSGSSIARKNGLENLSAQTGYALSLLKSMKKSGTTLAQDMRKYNGNLQSNYQMVRSSKQYKDDMKEQEGKLTMIDKKLGVKEKRITIWQKRVQTVKDIWKVLKDITKFGFKYKQELGITAAASYFGYKLGAFDPLYTKMLFNRTVSAVGPK